MTYLDVNIYVTHLRTSEDQKQILTIDVLLLLNFSRQCGGCTSLLRKWDFDLGWLPANQKKTHALSRYSNILSPYSYFLNYFIQQSIFCFAIFNRGKMHVTTHGKPKDDRSSDRKMTKTLRRHRFLDKLIYMKYYSNIPLK